jgi:phage baseplate assembly protein gpV
MTQVIVTDKDTTVIVQNPLNTRVITSGLSAPPASVSITNSSDVDLTNLADGGILVYDSATQKWTAGNILEKQIFEAGQF